jgi:hypothetical protein
VIGNQEKGIYNKKVQISKLTFEVDETERGR